MPPSRGVGVARRRETAGRGRGELHATSSGEDARRASHRALPRVERVAQPLAEQVERDDREQDRDARREHQPRRGPVVRAALVQHAAPRRRRRRRAEPEIRQHRLGEQVLREPERGHDDHDAEDVRQQVPHDDPPRARAERARGRADERVSVT